MENLDSLEIEEYDESSISNNQALHFMTLKRLKIDQSSVSMPSRITFDNLVELEIGLMSQKCTKWLEFVENYKNLKTLRVEFRIENEIVMRLARDWLNLHEISLKLFKDIEIVSIVQLIQNGRQLSKAHLDMTWASANIKPALDILRKEFNDQLIITHDSYDIHLERRATE